MGKGGEDQPPGLSVRKKEERTNPRQPSWKREEKKKRKGERKALAVDLSWAQMSPAQL